jgi:O-Antigen ligase
MQPRLQRLEASQLQRRSRRSRELRTVARPFSAGSARPGRRNGRWYAAPAAPRRAWSADLPQDHHPSGVRPGPESAAAPPLVARHAARPRASVAAVAIKTGWPAWLAALSINGFFVYLAVLDAVGTAPRTALTAAYYTVLGLLLGLAAWHRRSHLRERLGYGGRLANVAAVSAAVLVAWFLLNVALLSEGSLAHHLAAVLVLSTVPTALLIAALSARQLTRVAYGIVGLGTAFVLVEAVDLPHTHGQYLRYSPIAELDPISAARVPALAAVAVLVLRPADRRVRALLLACFTVFVASSVIPGSRGPVLGLVAAVGTLVLVQEAQWRKRVAILACLVVGLAAGFGGASQIDSSGHIETALPSFGGSNGGLSGEGISSSRIRVEWLKQAVSDIPDRPLFGHGVAMLADRTPEAERMGIAGERIYPHNSVVEAAYSLGVVGLASYVVFFGAAAWALARIAWRQRRNTAVLLAVGLGAYGFVEVNVSGEIGTDVVAWTAAALAIALYADQRRALDDA